MKKETKKLIFSIIIISLVIVVVVILAVISNIRKTPVSNELFDLYVDESFDKEEVLSRGYPTMFDVGGADCIPCKAMAPELKSANQNLEGKAIIKFIDFWEYPKLAEQFEFTSFPVQFFYDENGELYTVHYGGLTETEILEIFGKMGYDFE